MASKWRSRPTPPESGPRPNPRGELPRQPVGPSRVADRPHGNTPRRGCSRHAGAANECFGRNERSTRPRRSSDPTLIPGAGKRSEPRPDRPFGSKHHSSATPADQRRSVSRTPLPSTTSALRVRAGCSASLVGARGFEPPTPCAQGGWKPVGEMPYFQLITFQVAAAGLLKSVEPY